MNSTACLAYFFRCRPLFFRGIGTALFAIPLLLLKAHGQRYQPTGSGKSGPNHGIPKRAEPAPDRPARHKLVQPHLWIAPTMAACVIRSPM